MQSKRRNEISSARINCLLRNADIEGLIAAGAPRDEYSSEAEHIALELNELAADEYTEQNIISAISLVWTKNFNLDSAGLSLRASAIQNVAKEILKS